MTAHLTDVTTRRPIAPPRRPWAAWLGVGVLLVVLALGVALHSPWLSVQEIEIAGAERVQAAALLDRAGIGPGAIMIWLDTGAVEAAIAADPWTGAVRAHREWPDRLVIEVEERVPALWAEGTGGWMLLATDGTVLEVADAPGSGLLTARLDLPGVPVGMRSTDPVPGELVALSQALATPLASSSRVVSVDGELWMETPGHWVRLGTAIDLADKGRVAEVMLTDGLPEGATLDVVAPRRPAVIPPAAMGLVEPGVEADGESGSAPAVEGEGDGA
ncbi:MAG: FtsQ-type POTRA domain-containing protein [Actinomycetota bacterium]|nr:FtsQ-type POTRA domain-containing protein [Actinomycetota bacterium]